MIERKERTKYSSAIRHAGNVVLWGALEARIDRMQPRDITMVLIRYPIVQIGGNHNASTDLHVDMCN